MKLNEINSHDKLIPSRIYKKGDEFGELALCEKNGMRQGTMITVSECHFACVNAEIYERLMKKDK